jgi:hypothetical protein
MILTCDAARDQAAGFVLGALEPAEERDLREHLATCAEAHVEFAVLGGAAQYLDETVELVEPPATLRQRVLAAVASAPQTAVASPPQTPVASPPQIPVASAPQAATTQTPATEAAATEATEAIEAPAADTITGGSVLEARPAPLVDQSSATEVDPPLVAGAPIPTERPSTGPTVHDEFARPARRNRAAWLLGIAAALAIVALGGWNLYLQYQLGSAGTYDAAMRDVLDVAARPGSIIAALSAEGGGPRGIAAVGTDGSVALAVRDLQPTVGNEVYETWAIPPGGAPVPLGSFRVGSSGTAAMSMRGNTHVGGMTIALTRESGPGASAPTMPIVSKGIATAPAS